MKLQAVFVVLAATACAATGADRRPRAADPATRTLTIAAYTTPREVFAQRILPGFAAEWKRAHRQTVTFRDSYAGSGAQARAVANGFEADVAALSLEADVNTLVGAKLITRPWATPPDDGIVSRSLVVIAVRPGNPKHIRDWADLVRPGIAVLTPNPATSGGAMWNIAAIVGAAERGAIPGVKRDAASVEKFLTSVLANVAIMDKGGRESMLTFEQGVGDAAITYENEVVAARKAGKHYDYVIPSSTIWIENPAATVEVYATKHGNLDIADAFVRYLSGTAAQTAFAEFGYRPIAGAKLGTLPNDAVLPAPPSGAFTIRDIGGWPVVTKTIFGDGGMFERAQDEALADK